MQVLRQALKQQCFSPKILPKSPRALLQAASPAFKKRLRADNFGTAHQTQVVDSTYRKHSFCQCSAIGLSPSCTFPFWTSEIPHPRTISDCRASTTGRNCPVFCPQLPARKACAWAATTQVSGRLWDAASSTGS